MALKTVDLTQQPHRAIFTGCSQEEVNYAKTFWQSLQLLPPMESRLVSSDIKQRLRKAPPSRSMSECITNKSDESVNRKLSFSITLNNSRCCLPDNGSKPTIHLQATRTDSLRTQTSLIPDFGDLFDETEIEGSSSPLSRERNYEEPSHKKTYVSAAEKEVGMNQEAGNKLCILGAGGGEFLDRKGESWENELTRTIQPFSGEDLCRGKGFLNWGEHTVLSKLAGSPTYVEFGGEELRGKHNLQYPAISLPDNVVSGGTNSVVSSDTSDVSGGTNNVVSGGTNNVVSGDTKNVVSGDNIQKHCDSNLQKLNENKVQKPKDGSLQKPTDGNKQKLSGGQHSSSEKNSHREAPLQKSSLHQSKKRQQRVVGRKQEVSSLFQSRNIPPEKFDNLTKSTGVLTDLLLPVLNIGLLPEAFSRQTASRETDDFKINKPKKQGKRSNNKSKAIAEKVSHSQSEKITQQGKTDHLKNQWKFVKTVTKPDEILKESRKTQTNNPVQISCTGSDENKVGLCDRADSPLVSIKPRKDVIYWTNR